jgi:hypothetical protein
MKNQLNNVNKIVIQIFLLVILWNIIKFHPDIINYNTDIKFNMYRSLVCLSFTILSLYNTLKYIKLGYHFPFKFHTENFNEIHNLFIAYILFDLYKMISSKNTRIDLYLHHLWCLGSFILAKYYNHCGFFHNFLLFNELISIVSGIDSIAIENNNMKESYNYKVIRKNIIKYIRLPIWIILLIFTIKYTGRIPRLLWYNGVMTTLIMIFLDRYWEKKCDKVINKYL